MIRKKSAMKVQNHKSTKEAANSNGTSSRATDTTAKEARKNEAQAASPYQCNEPEVDSNGRSKVRLVEKANRGKSLLFCAPTFSPPNEVYRCTKKERLADLENPDIIGSTVPVKPILKCENSNSARYIDEESKLVQAELSSLKKVCSKIERELQQVESLEESEAEWESLNQDWLTLAKFCSEVMK